MYFSYNDKSLKMGDVMKHQSSVLPKDTPAEVGTALSLRTELLSPATMDIPFKMGIDYSTSQSQTSLALHEFARTGRSTYIVLLTKSVVMCLT